MLSPIDRELSFAPWLVPFNRTMEAVIGIIYAIHQFRHRRRCSYRLSSLKIQNSYSQIDPCGSIAEHFPSSS